jgi:hypothetical protein
MTVSPQITSPSAACGAAPVQPRCGRWASGAVISGHYSGWNLGLMAGAMLSYLLQLVSFIVLRRRLPGLKRAPIARRSALQEP